MLVSYSWKRLFGNAPTEQNSKEEALNMRVLLSVTFPPEPFNTLVKEKRASQILNRILNELKPEAAYFTEEDGSRGGVLIINLSEPSRIPFFAEPFFLNFNALCRFRIAMTPEDLAKAELDKIGEKWK
jgi:hypothetical protein